MYSVVRQYKDIFNIFARKWCPRAVQLVHMQYCSSALFPWHMADSRLAPSQWDTSLQSNAVFNWLGENFQSVLPTLRWPHWFMFSLLVSQIGDKPLPWLIEAWWCISLQWCHKERDGVSNHRRPDCWINRLFRGRSKKTSKPRVTGLCEGNSPVTGGSPHKGQ